MGIGTNIRKVIFKYIEDKLGYFVTYWKRPRSSYDIFDGNSSYSSSDVAIVLQGPLLLDDDFTYETILLYRKTYPLCKIILSTWEDSDIKSINRIKKIGGVEVCLSKIPKVRGRENINLQKKSSIAGIELAQSLGCKYVLKSRTDQRMYKSNIVLFLLKLLTNNPLNVDISSNSRLIVTSLGTFKNRLYNISDMFVFGEVEDVYKFFNVPEVSCLEDEFIYPKDQVEYSKLRPGEIYFTTNYIESLGYELKWTIHDSDYYRNSLFIVIDDEMVDLFWPKYNNYEHKFRQYGSNRDLFQCTFSEWYISKE